MCEDQALQADLACAGIEPFAWVVNESLVSHQARDPVLAEGRRVSPKGMRGCRAIVVWLGMAVLGACIWVSAIVSVVIRRQMFKDQFPTSTWIGLAVILAGSMIALLGQAS